jgi:hypothetical protein
MDRETLASDVLENWTPPETDTHPDDCPRAFDDAGAPILRCPMVPAVNIHTMRMERMGGFRTREVVKFDGARVETSLEFGAIEGAGGTWWVPKSSAWSVEPSRIRALSPRGRAWLKSTLARLAHATLPGDTNQRTAPLEKACRSGEQSERYDAPGRPPHPGARAKPAAMKAWGKAVETFDAARKASRCVRFHGVDASGVVVLSLTCSETNARAIVDAYSIAGRPLTLRPA